MVFLHMLAFQQICKLYETQLTLSNTREKSAFPKNSRMYYSVLYSDSSSCYSLAYEKIKILEGILQFRP